MQKRSCGYKKWREEYGSVPEEKKESTQHDGPRRKGKDEVGGAVQQ